MTRAWLVLLLAGCSSARPDSSLSVNSLSAELLACSDPTAGQSMVARLYRDQEFLDFTCDDPPCEAAGFMDLLAFEQKVLRDQPPMVGCFVTPTGWRLRNMSALFTLEAGDLQPRYQLTYLGNWLYPDTLRRDGRPRDLIGTHKMTADEWIKERFVWEGNGYVDKGEEPSGR